MYVLRLNVRILWRETARKVQHVITPISALMELEVNGRVHLDECHIQRWQGIALCLIVRSALIGQLMLRVIVEQRTVALIVGLSVYLRQIIAAVDTCHGTGVEVRRARAGGHINGPLHDVVLFQIQLFRAV